MNDISATIFYNQRFIISAPIPEPLAWRLTKVEDVSPKGVRRLTFAQDNFNQHSDYIEKDENGNIIGMWADYFKSNIEPSPIPIDDVPPSSTTSKITCSGKPQFKIGGSAKTFTVTFYDDKGQVITDHDVGTWSWSIDGTAIPNELFDINLDGYKAKLKFLGDDSYIGKILTIQNISEDVTASLDVEIIAL